MAARNEMYEANAQVCEQHAEAVKEPEAKESYQVLATAWRSLARDADLLDIHDGRCV